MTSAQGALVAVLDANVLYPQWLRDVMLTLAVVGFYDPIWSEQIIDEMRRSVLRDHPAIAPQLFDDVTIAALRRVFPDAWIDVPEDLVAQMDNSHEDRHVLATAVAASAQVVVTANTGDFDSPQFVASGRVKIVTPSTFLSSALAEHEDVVAEVLEHLAANRRGVTTTGDVLDELHRNEALRSFVDLARNRLL